MNKLILSSVIAGGALALGACASHPNDPANASKTAEQQPHKVCVSSTPLGSHIAKVRCMSQADYAVYQKARQKKAEENQNALQKQRNGSGGG